LFTEALHLVVRAAIAEHVENGFAALDTVRLGALADRYPVVGFSPGGFRVAAFQALGPRRATPDRPGKADWLDNYKDLS